MCGTLLAFSSLSRIRAEEGVLLGDRGFGPCVATLRPAGECRPGEHDSTCPYLIVLPPLVVDLPQHLQELENIVLDLQKLKDSVDELREMCADCTGGQAGRKCERKSGEELSGGKSTHEDVRDWMNERPKENDTELERGKNCVKVEKMVRDNNMEKKLKDRNEWETGGVVKENEREEPVTQGARGEDTLVELKVPTSGGNMESVNVTREENTQTNPKGGKRKFQDDMLEESKEITKEQSGHPMWRDKTKKMENITKAEASDGIKMSTNHTVNINKVEGQTEMEKGIKVDPNKKKPKQMESFGLTEKSREIKTESKQRDGDGETSSNNTTERTDFLSITLTPLTTGLTSGPDSSDTKSFTSSLPSPSLLSSTLSSIADVIPDSKAGYGLTETTEPGAAGVTEVQNQVEARLSTTTETISSVGGPEEQIPNDAVAGLAYTTPTATTALQSSFITSSTTVIDRRHWVPKKNIGSKSKTDLKRPSVQASKPGEKQKSGFKPEAEKRRKNAKNDHKPNQGPSTEGKTKLNQKQKPHKPTGVKPKLGKDSKQTQDEKSGQRTTPDISTTTKNEKTKLMHKQEVEFNKPKSKQNSATSFQRPQDVNTTDPGKYMLINRQYDNVSDTDQKLKLETKLVQPFITTKSDQKSDVRLNSGEQLNDTFELTQNPKSNPINYLMTKYIQKITTFKPEHIWEYQSTPVPNQKLFNESVSKFEETIEHEMTKSPDLTPGQNTIADRPHTSSDNMNDSKPSQKFETKTTTHLTESVGNSEENSLQEPKYNPDLPPAETSLLDKATVSTDQKINSSQDHFKTKNKQESTQESSTESIKRETSTKTPKQTLLIEPINQSNENRSHDAKLNPDVTTGWTSALDQPRVTDHLMNKSSQGIHTTKHKPNSINPKSEINETTASPKPNQMLSTLFGNKAEENPLRKTKNPQNLTAGQKVISDQANTTLDYMNKSSQEDHKHKNKPETNREHTSDKANKSEEFFLQEFILNPHLTPGLDQATKNPDQKTKSREDYFKDTHNPKDIDRFKSNKSETSNTKPSAKLVDITEETSWQEPTPNPGLKPGYRFNPDQGSTNPDQIKKSSENYFKDKHKPEKIQEFNSERATPKPNQRLLPESVDQWEDFQEPTSYPDLTPGQKSKPNQVTTTPDHKNKTNRKHPKSQTSQEFKFNKSETVTQKPSVESRDKFQEKSLQKPTSNPGLPQTSTIDLPYQPNKSSQDHFNTKHNTEKYHDFTFNKSKTTPEPNQKLLPKSVDKSEEKKQTKSYLDSTHGQTSISDQTTTNPDQVNTVHDKHHKTQTSKKFKFTKSETASPKTSTEFWNTSEKISLQGPTPDPGLTSRHISTMDLSTTVPDHIKKSTNIYLQTEPSYDTKFNKGETARSKPLTDSWHKSKKAHLQEPSNPGLAHGEASTLDLDTAAVDRINKSLHNHHGAQQNPESIEDFQSNESKTTKQKPSPEPKGGDLEHKNRSESEPAPDQAKTLPDQRSKPNPNVPKFNKKPEPGQEPRHNKKNLKIAPNLKTRPNANINQTKQTHLRPKTPRPGLKPNLKTIPEPEKRLNATYNKTPKERPPFRHKPSMRPTVKQEIKPIQRPKQAAEPEPSPQTKTDPPQIRWVPSGNNQNSRTDMPPTSGLVKQIAEVSHTPGETEFSTSVRKTITLRPKTYNSLENGYFPAIHTHPEDVTLSPNSRIMSDPRPQTAGLPPSVPLTTRPNNTNRGILQNVITSTAPGTTKPTIAPISEAKTLHEEESPPASPVPSPKLETTSRLSLNFRPKTSSTSGPEPPPAELSTSSPRELRVKINQVTAFVNSSMIPNRRPEELPKEQPKGSQRGGGREKTDGKLPTSTAFTGKRLLL